MERSSLKHYAEIVHEHNKHFLDSSNLVGHLRHFRSGTLHELELVDLYTLYLQRR